MRADMCWLACAVNQAYSLSTSRDTSVAFQEAVLHQISSVMLRLAAHQPRTYHPPQHLNWSKSSASAWEAKQSIASKLLATLQWRCGVGFEKGVQDVERDQPKDVPSLVPQCRLQFWSLLDYLLTDYLLNPELHVAEVTSCSK